MFYFDERGVLRKQDVGFQGNQLKWWRDNSTFVQRFIIVIEEDGNTMVGRGEMSREGREWEDDLSTTFVRVR